MAAERPETSLRMSRRKLIKSGFVAGAGALTFQGFFTYGLYAGSEISARSEDVARGIYPNDSLRRERLAEEIAREDVDKVAKISVGGMIAGVTVAVVALVKE